MATLALVIFGLLSLLAMARLVRPIASLDTKAEATPKLPFWTGLLWR